MALQVDIPFPFSHIPGLVKPESTFRETGLEGVFPAESVPELTFVDENLCSKLKIEKKKLD